MSYTTLIQWTCSTFNVWTGCTEVSPGCFKCYAEGDKWRHGVEWGRGKPRKPMSLAYWKKPYTWNREAEKAGERHRVFCSSWADVFDDEGIESERQNLWQLIRDTPWLDWQLLTKRPNLIRRFFPPDLHNAPNVWLGTSLENADYLWRIAKLIETPAVVHFLSVEPQLGPIPDLPLADIEWVINGGESGPWFPGCRLTREEIDERRLVYKTPEGWLTKPDRIEWVQTIRDQCLAAGVPFFFKQWGGPTPKSGGRLLDGRMWDEMPQTLATRQPVPVEKPTRTPIPIEKPKPKREPVH